MITSPVAATGVGHPPLALLVDRDADTRQMYAEFLRQSACEIDEAEDGREALVKALTRHPDVIVTETRLPGINGFDLCQLLRRDAATSKIPIVLVTGDSYETDARRAEAVGADAILVKPCLPEQLGLEIQRVLTLARDLQTRAQAVRDTVGALRARSDALIEQSRTSVRHVMLSRTHDRRETIEPPLAPPALVCPLCDHPLNYVKSHLGGVSARHPEQWDYFECAAGCGTFQYRQRTRKLRRAM